MNPNVEMIFFRILLLFYYHLLNVYLMQYLMDAIIRTAVLTKSTLTIICTICKSLGTIISY